MSSQEIERLVEDIKLLRRYILETFEKIDVKLKEQLDRIVSQYDRLTILETKAIDRERRVENLEKIEAGRTAKLISVVGISTSIVLLIFESIKLIFHR